MRKVLVDDSFDVFFFFLKEKLRGDCCFILRSILIFDGAVG